MPCATVELAAHDGRPGCAVRSFVPGGASLVHGNELLQETDETYPTIMLRGVSKHTVSSVLSVLEGVTAPASSDILPTGSDHFVGFLLLDAIILNSDRHHEKLGGSSEARLPSTARAEL